MIDHVRWPITHCVGHPLNHVDDVMRCFCSIFNYWSLVAGAATCGIFLLKSNDVQARNLWEGHFCVHLRTSRPLRWHGKIFCQNTKKRKLFFRSFDLWTFWYFLNIIIIIYAKTFLTWNPCMGSADRPPDTTPCWMTCWPRVIKVWISSIFLSTLRFDIVLHAISPL